MTTRATRTRDRLQRHALRLIAAQGFDQTTVEQIAAAAGVSHMTFFRHFPTKESVVMDDPYDPVVAEQVAATPTDLPPLQRVREGLLRAWGQVPEPNDEITRVRVNIAVGHPALRAKVWESNQATMDLVVDALVADGTDRLRATAAAGACMGAITAALLDWGAEEGGQPLGERIVAALGVLAAGEEAVTPTSDRTGHDRTRHGRTRHGRTRSDERART